jgi:hypothetical protein
MLACCSGLLVTAVLRCLPQVVEEGYEFFAKRQLVTIFSAPNYCGEFENAGAMMSVDETLMCSFQVGHSAAAGGRKLLWAWLGSAVCCW